MAWNPSPKIADCRDIARKWRVQQVVIVAVDRVRGVFEINSYGETKALCDDAKGLADAIYSLMAAEETKP